MLGLTYTFEPRTVLCPSQGPTQRLVYLETPPHSNEETDQWALEVSRMKSTPRVFLRENYFIIEFSRRLLFLCVIPGPPHPVTLGQVIQPREYASQV